MKRSSGVLIGTLAAAVLLSACNNNNNNGVNPSPPPGCGNPPFQLEVLYPKPNANRIPPNVPAVYVAFSAPLPSGNNYDLAAVQSNGTSQLTVNNNGQPITSPGSGFIATTAAQIPLPHANPTYANPQYFATLFQFPIGPLQTVNLYWNDAGTGCTPNVIVSSFSTK